MLTLTKRHIEHVKWFFVFIGLLFGLITVDSVQAAAIHGPMLIGYIGGAVNDICVQGDYAYLATHNGLEVLDVSNLSNPVKVGKLKLSTQGTEHPYKVFLAGTIAYVANGTDGLQIIDVSDPAYPTSLSNYDTPGEVRDVFVSDNIAYVADWFDGIQIIDVNDPLAPAYLGSFSTYGLAHGIFVSGNTAYVADWNAGLKIIDVSDPSSPRGLGGYYTGGYAINVFICSNTAYVLDRDSGLHIIDVSDPFNPMRRGSYDIPLYSGKDLFVANNVAYLSFNHYLKIIDLNDPSNPIILGSYDTALGDYDYTGAEGVFLSNTTAYIANGSNGVQIIDVTNPADPQPLGSYIAFNARDVYVSANKAYIVDQASGLHIIDITNPFDPTFLGSYATPGLADDVFVSGTTAYVADYFNLQIIDVGNPANPTILSAYKWCAPISCVFVSGTTAFVGEAGGVSVVDVTNSANPIFRGNCGTGRARNIFAFGTIVYTAARLTDFDGLRLTDITNFEHPVFHDLVGYNTPGFANDVFVSGSVAYVADGSKGLQIIDVFDPTNTVLLGNYDTPGNAEGVFVSGSTAYVADYSEGLQIIDVTDPSTPTLIANYDTSDYARKVFVAGNIAYVADGRGGLKLIDITGIQSSNQPPTKPNLIAPQDGETGVGLTNTVFSWNPSTDPDGDSIEYCMVLKKDNEPEDTPVYMGCSKGDFITAPPDTCPTFILPEDIELEGGTKYWWAIRAKDQNDNWSEASEWWSFATINNDNDGDGMPDNLDEDDDNDGMPDDWENTYGLDPLFDDSGADFDGDTFSNLQEFQAGSDPTEPPEYGTTIITHGFILGLGDHDGTLQEKAFWTITMAEAIGERAGRATIYFFKDGKLDKKEYIGGGAGPNGMQGENILVFDWIAESDRFIEGYAEAAGDSLFANLMEGAIKGEWSLEHLHFIGHSRGCVVNSECIQRLLYIAGSNNLPSGILVDNNIHMTTLDPHPWDDYDRGPDSNDNAVNGNIGCGVVGWKADSGSEEFRTGYIDNYYQHNHRIHMLPLSHPTGLESYPGAYYNVNLSCMEANVTEYLERATGYSGKWMNHSGVHAWYHGTIKHDAENDGDGLDIGIYRQNWYEEPLCNGESPFGYNKSRIGDGDLEIYSALLNQLRDVTADNTFVDPLYKIPNLIFNGDFSKSEPGWELQGGGGNGHIDHNYLELDDGNTWLRHNKLYIPQNVNSLAFQYEITNADMLFSHDTLQVWLLDSQDTSQDVVSGLCEIEAGCLCSIPLDHKARGWILIDIERYKGTVRTLTFKIANCHDDPDCNGDVDSEIRIDNVSLQADADFDGLPDAIEREWMACLDLNNNDSDGDGLLDGIEDANHNGIFDFDQGETNPCDADTDNDGLVDGNTGSEDLNANGIVDPGETDPLSPDTDGDGIFDGTERGLTEPETEHTDVSVGFFVADIDPSTTTDPTDADSDDDGILDGNEDKNHDGLVDPSAGETDPGNPDSDGDGIYDGTEIGLTEPQDAEATNLLQGHFVPDSDPASTTDPAKPDSDGDGIGDGDEDVNKDGSFSPELGETDPNSAAGIRGDLDGDCDVDYDDYLIFRTAYGSCSGDENFLPGADLDGDGCVTINDYRMLRTLM